MDIDEKGLLQPKALFYGVLFDKARLTKAEFRARFYRSKSLRA